MIRTAFVRGRAAVAFAVAAACAAVACALPTVAAAGPADLDPGFGTAGTGYASFETAGGSFNGDLFRDVATGGPGGSTTAIVVNTGSTVAEPGNDESGIAVFDGNGQLDTRFGGDGTVSHRFGNRSDVRGVAVQPDGKIVVVGKMDTNDGARGYVARFTVNGSLDTTWAAGGFKTLTYGGTFDVSADAVLIDPDGAIVVAGTGDGNVDFAYFLQKLTPGAADVHPVGAATWPDGGAGDLDDDGARSLIRAADGQYFVAGTLFQDLDNDTVYERTIAVGRWDATGFPQPFVAGGQHYGTPGVLDTGGNNLPTHGRSVAVLNGKIYAGGVTDPAGGAKKEIVLAAFNATGARDNSFGSQGVRKFGDSSRDLYVRDLAVTDGKLFGIGATTGVSGSDILAIRWLANGDPDGTWSPGGIKAFDLGNVSPSQGEDVGLAFAPDGRPIVGGTAFKAGIFGAVGRLGTVDIAPPPPDGGSGGGGSGGGGTGGGGSGTPDTGNPGTGGTGTGGGNTPPPIQFADTTVRAKMPDVRGVDVQKAINRLDGRFFTDIDVKYTNEKTSKADEIGQVAAQKPAPGTELASAAGDPERVVLTVYEGPKPVGKSKCPEADLKKELKGLGAVFSVAVAKQLKCRVEVEVVPAPAAKDESVSKVTAKNNKVVVTIKQPTKPERNELFLAFHGVRPVKTNTTFNAADWTVPVGPISSFGVTVMTRSGDLVKNANLTIDGSKVGGRDYSRMSGADGPGMAYLTVQPKKEGSVTVTARGEVGGQVVTGVGVINVRDVNGTFTTVNGQEISLDSRGAVKKVTEPTVRSASLQNLWTQFLSAIGFGSPVAQQVNQPGRSPAQNLSSPQGKKTYPVQLALGQPLSGNAKATPQKAGSVGVVRNGQAGKANAPVIDMTRGNVIGASGNLGQGNATLIGQASGNLIGPAVGNVISREIDLKRAKIISDNGLGILSDNGLGLISDNGLGIISDNGMGLLPPKNQMLATSVPGILSTYGSG